jgi:hypothetical protein
MLFCVEDAVLLPLSLQLGADLVTMFTGLDRNVVRECGRGYIGGGQKYAMSIICAGCFDGYTLAHEVCEANLN